MFMQETQSKRTVPKHRHVTRLYSALARMKIRWKLYPQ